MGATTSSDDQSRPGALRPFLRWAGSKRRLISTLAEYWQCDTARYVEPFMGSAALFFALQPTKALLSDANPELVRTFRFVRKHPRKLYARVAALPRDRDLYYELRGQRSRDLSPLDRATRFLYLNRYCFNGIFRTNRKGSFNVPFAATGTGTFPTWEEFEAASKLLRRSAVVTGDFEHILRARARAGDFVYLDPPFAVGNRRIFRQYTQHSFGLDDLARLASVLTALDDVGAVFVLSYAYCREALQSFQQWSMRKVYCQRNVAGFAAHRRKAAELIVSNAPLPAELS